MSLGVVRNSVKPHKPGASNDFSAYVSFLASSRLSPVIQRIEWVSGIGQDDAEPVVLAEACALASRCPKVAHCPLSAEG